MRILHTADWHLCDRLGRLDRTDDLKKRVERVAEYCEEHRVEVLLVAGDLFYERATPDEMADALRHVQRAFGAFFARGGTVLAITGNHDDDAKIELVRAGMSLAASVPYGDLPPGRLYLQNGLSCCTLKTPGGERAQFVLVPYPFATRYELSDEYRTREEEFRLLQHKLAEWVAGLRADATRFDTSLPTVLVAHLHVRGANLNKSLFRFSNPADIQMEPADLKAGWAYVALGHIHLPQMLDGLETLRYPGPLDRLDFGEKDDERGVLLLDLGPTGLTAPPAWLPMEPTPMREIVIKDPDAELDVLKELYPDRETAIVKVEVTQQLGTKLGRDEIGRRLKATFPRLLSIDWKGDVAADVESDSLAKAASGGKAFADTVREYLATSLEGDADRDGVLQLCETMLADV